MKKDHVKEHEQIDQDPLEEEAEIEEDFFDDEGEDEDEIIDHTPFVQRKWVRKGIALIFAIALIGNVLAFWPQVYSLAAIQFLIKSTELSQNAEVQLYKQAVVIVKSGDSKGTGFNIADDGLIITNHHVVEGEERSMVHFPNGQTYAAQVVVSDANQDIAILDIDGSNLSALELAEDADGDLGQPIYVIGNPLFFEQIANEGHVLGIHTNEVQDRLVIDAPIYKGNSGSPVINHQGQVIGVVFATTRITMDNRRQKVGLAIPISDIHKYIEDVNTQF